MPSGVGAAKMHLVRPVGDGVVRPDQAQHPRLIYTYRPRFNFIVRRLWVSSKLDDHVIVAELKAGDRIGLLDETPLWLLLGPPPWNPEREPLHLIVPKNMDVCLKLHHPFGSAWNPPEIWLLGDYVQVHE